MELTANQIESLHQRHAVLTAQIREGLERLEEINAAIESKQLPNGTGFDDIGTPLKERPA